MENNASASKESLDNVAPYNPIQERFLRLPEVIHLCGLSRSGIYELINKKAFPKQVTLGGKNVAWLQSEINLWMMNRISSRTEK